MLSCAENTDMELPLKLLLTLGLRRGELLALKWDHVDFEKSTITIDQNNVYVGKNISKDGFITKAPKSLSGIRTLCASNKLMDLLKRYYNKYLEMGKSGNYNDLGYVVCQPDGKPYTPNAITRKFKRFLEKNNLKDIRLHDLRHTNATLMLKSQCNRRRPRK